MSSKKTVNPIGYFKCAELERLGRHEEALQCYNKAIELNPNYDAAWNNKGNTLENLGRREEALQCYNKAIELNHHHPDAWRNKGVALWKLGRREEARQCIKKAVELGPRFSKLFGDR